MKMGHSQTVYAKTGALVLMVEGKATASLVDPEFEAEKWYDGLLQRPENGAACVVVIGVGSGYHIKLLARHCLEVIAIDSCEQSIEFLKSSGQIPSNVRLEYVGPQDFESRGQQFLARASVQEWLFSSFHLIPHRPSFVRDRNLSHIEDWLIGRSVESMRLNLAVRPDLLALLDSVKISEAFKRKMITQSLFSVKDVAASFAKVHEGSSERRIFRLLEELVK